MIKQLLFSLFAISTLCTCNNKQPDSVDANEDWTITEYGVGIIQIESSISQIKKTLEDNFTIETHDNGTLGFDIMNEGDVQIKIYEFDTKVSLIEIYSSKYSTNRGINVDMTIEEIEKIYKEDFKPQMDSHNGRVYFKPKDLQSENSSLTIYFIKKDDSPVWNFTKKPNGERFLFEPKGDIDKKSIVERIIIEEIK